MSSYNRRFVAHVGRYLHRNFINELQNRHYIIVYTDDNYRIHLSDELTTTCVIDEWSNIVDFIDVLDEFEAKTRRFVLSTIRYTIGSSDGHYIN